MLIALVVLFEALISDIRLRRGTRAATDLVDRGWLP